MKQNIKLSVVILVHNEESLLEKCLQSVKAIADEIIVIDAQSTDGSSDVAKRYTSNIYNRPNNLLLQPNKNFGFQKAKGEWILNLDADEKLTPELAEEIREVIKLENDVEGYRVPRKNIIFGKWIENSIWWPDYQLRLFKKNSGKFAEKHVHEQIDIDGKVGKLVHPMLHENYTSINQWLSKMGNYTDNEMSQKIEKGVNITPLDALRFPMQDFLKTYFMQKGYRDGLHGLVLSILQAFYAEIVFAKMWEKQGFTQNNDPKFSEKVIIEFKKFSYEFRYWTATIAIENTVSPVRKAVLMIKRKIALKKFNNSK